jgi:hypothetical protein
MKCQIEDLILYELILCHLILYDLILSHVFQFN